MATVLHRISKKLIESANTPDYSSDRWIIGPDLSNVIGSPSKYWKIDGDAVLLMTEEEKALVDAEEPSIERDSPVLVYEDRTLENILKIKKPKTMSKVFATDLGTALTFDGNDWMADGTIKEKNTEDIPMSFGDIVAFKASGNGVCYTTEKNNKDIAGCVLIGADSKKNVVVKIGGIVNVKVIGACLAMDFINPSTTPGVGAAQTNQSKGSFAKALDAKTTTDVATVRCIMTTPSAASYGAK